MAQLFSLGHIERMRFHNIQFSAPETDRKVMLVVSSIFMLVIWFTVAGFVLYALLHKQQPDAHEMTGREIVASCGVVLVLLFIPIQLARYYREWRTL